MKRYELRVSNGVPLHVTADAGEWVKFAEVEATIAELTRLLALKPYKDLMTEDERRQYVVNLARKAGA